MIGMMYLVLTALLALNVSKDILEAFEVVNNGLENTIESFEVKNQTLYGAFDLAMQVDAEKARPYYERAKEARQLANQMASFIDSLKLTVITRTEDIPREVADTLQMGNFTSKDNYDIPTNLMIGDSQDGSAGRSAELKTRLLDFKQQMLALLDEDDRLSANLGLDLERTFQHDGVTMNWEMNTFYHSPLSATVTIFNQLETEVRNAEFYVVNNLLKSVNGKAFPVDTIAAKVFAQSNYVPLGQDYEADIFLAAFSKTSQPQILLGDLDPETGQLLRTSDSVNVENGLGRYVVKPTREGLHEYSGVIRLKDQENNIIEQPFSTSYLVAKPNLVMSLEKMNAFYVGPTNPISVSVPGVPAENFEVEASGGHRVVKKGPGQYDVICSPNGQRLTTVRVRAKFPNGETQLLESIRCRVLNLPLPYCRFGPPDTPVMSKATACAQLGLIAEYDPNFIFDLDVKVKSFTMLASRGSQLTPEQRASGPRLTQEMKNIICQLSRGDRIFFEDIVIEEEGGGTRNVKNITVKVM